MGIAFVSIVVLLYPSYCLTQTSKEYFHSLGDTVTLLCTLQKETNPITWGFQFNTTFIIQYSTNNQVNPNLEGISGRLSIVGNYDLQISTIEKNDEGTYKCGTNINGQLRQHFATLSIVRPPTDLLIQNVKDRKVLGIEGQFFSLNCTAVDGKPPPEVTLTVSGVSVSVTGIQSIQYTSQQVTRDFDKQTVTCTANHSVLSSVLKEIVTVYLNLKPFKPTFSQTFISTEETIPLTISCNSKGSRPPASFQWYIGSTNITAFAVASSHIQPEDTYTVYSTLTYLVNRSSNTKDVICKVTNIADLIGTQVRRQLDVRYAPDITVNSPNYTQNDAIRTVTCNPSGNPHSYTYHKWQHKSKYGELIREFNGIKTLMLPDAPEELRYQDSGQYICIASNGIKDNNNKFEQTGYGYVIVQALPVFTTDTIDRVKQFGEIGKAVEVYVYVYSVPQFTIDSWTSDGKPITHHSAKYESSSTPTIVKDKIHGKEVQLDGYNVTLTIHDLQAEDFTNYTVTLKSRFADVKYTIMLKSASVPETPNNFSRIASSFTSITVQWDPNFGGGYKQTFYIQYKVQGLLEWTTESAGEEDINEPKRRRTYELIELQEGKVYELRMFAENTAMKTSNVTDVLIVSTESSVSTTSSVVIGTVIGVPVTLVIVCASFIVILLFKRRQVKDQKEKNDKYYENTGFQDLQKGDEYEEVENKFDEKHEQSNKTHETPGTKDAIDVYDDLGNPEGVTSSKSSLGHYEALGVQDNPSIYSEINNKKTEQRQLRKQLAGKTQLKHSNNPKEIIELDKRQDPTERVYANEVF